MAINKSYLVEKRNVLNEFRSKNMTLQELRFFSIYLSKINPRDHTSRLVKFSLTDFQKIMGLGKLNISQLRTSIKNLLAKVVEVPLKKDGFECFHIFKKGTFIYDENKGWYIEIDAHDDALPLMFEFKDRYFTYELWNALRLKSSNQLRMYEILKQYEKIGERILKVEELRELLGINKDEYMRFNSFREKVIDACQKSLREHTDITFTYESVGKRGKGGKILTLKFHIFKNDSHVDQLSLSEFIDLQNYQNNDEEFTVED
jgi:plasmid replication initiation protein